MSGYTSELQPMGASKGVDGMERNVNNMQEGLKEMQKLNSTSMSQLQDLQGALALSIVELQKTEDENQQLKLQIHQHKSADSDLRKVLREEAENWKEYQTEKEAISSRLKVSLQLSSLLQDSFDTSLEAFEKHLERIRETKATKIKAFEDYNSAIQSIKESWAREKKAKHTAECTLKTIKKQIKDSEQECEDTQLRIEQAEKENEKLNLSCEELDKQLLEVSKEKKVRQALLEEKQKELDKWENMYRKVLRALENDEKHREDLKKQLSLTQSEGELLEVELVKAGKKRILVKQLQDLDAEIVNEQKRQDASLCRIQQDYEFLDKECEELVNSIKEFEVVGDEEVQQLQAKLSKLKLQSLKSGEDQIYYPIKETLKEISKLKLDLESLDKKLEVVDKELDVSKKQKDNEKKMREHLDETLVVHLHKMSLMDGEIRTLHEEKKCLEKRLTEHKRLRERRERLERDRKKQELLEREREERERKERERKERERKERERKERERKERERKERERKERERMEQERKEQEREEQERKEQERKVQERKEQERKEQERKEQERKEQERKEQERKEQELREQERKKLERKKRERKERERLAQERERKEFERLQHEDRERGREKTKRERLVKGHPSLRATFKVRISRRRSSRKGDVSTPSADHSSSRLQVKHTINRRLRSYRKNAFHMPSAARSSAGPQDKQKNGDEEKDSPKSLGQSTASEHRPQNRTEKLKGTGQHLLSRTPEQENVPEGKHKRKRRRRSRWLQANSETPAEANSGSKPSENVSKPRSKAKPDFENGSKEDYVEPEVDVQPQFDDDMLQSDSKQDQQSEASFSLFDDLGPLATSESPKNNSKAGLNFSKLRRQVSPPIQTREVARRSRRTVRSKSSAVRVPCKPKRLSRRRRSHRNQLQQDSNSDAFAFPNSPS
ncbi:hypothetical protein AAMO2058_001537700 [Amorphochlora amoebiformis]